MTISDWCIVLATFSGPIFAVQVTRWLDDRKEKRDRKFQIFNTLMATRAYGLFLEHIGALNRIDVEFIAKEDKKVIDAWRAYHDHLCNHTLGKEAWADKQLGLFSDLLWEMSVNLGYNFDKTYIKNMSYSPVKHSEIESEQDQIRKTLLKVLAQESLPITITNFPSVQNNEASDSKRKIS